LGEIGLEPFLGFGLTEGSELTVTVATWGASRGSVGDVAEVNWTCAKLRHRLSWWTFSVIVWSHWFTSLTINTTLTLFRRYSHFTLFLSINCSFIKPSFVVLENDGGRRIWGIEM